jgi:hypothetical protein
VTAASQFGSQRNNLETAGRNAESKFARILPIVEARRLGMYNRRTANTLTNDDYNAIGIAMYQPDGTRAALQVHFGFNHLAKAGRSFRGSCSNMFYETCRCWKCRFVHHYNVNAGLPASDGSIVSGAVVRENPRLTPVHANGPLMCAEDLVHFQCIQLAPIVPAAPMPAEPLPVI